MSVSLVSFNKKSFIRFSILFHKTTEILSLENKKSPPFYFYIPSNSLQRLHQIEKKVEKTNPSIKGEINILVGFEDEQTKKIIPELKKRIIGGSSIEKTSDNAKITRSRIKIVNMKTSSIEEENDKTRYKSFRKENQLGLIIERNNTCNTRDHFVKRFIKHYLEGRENETSSLFFIFEVPYEKNKKMIKKTLASDKFRNNIGNTFIERFLPITKAYLRNKKRDLKNVEFFFSTHKKIKRFQPKIEGFRPILLYPKAIIYPYQMYVNLLKFLKEENKNS